jgi:hypothetical protein
LEELVGVEQEVHTTTTTTTTTTATTAATGTPASNSSELSVLSVLSAAINHVQQGLNALQEHCTAAGTVVVDRFPVVSRFFCFCFVFVFVFFCFCFVFVFFFALVIDLLTDKVLLSRVAAGSVPRCGSPPQHGHQDRGSHSTSVRRP